MPASAPLRLERYFYPHVVCKANLNYNPQGRNSVSRLRIDAQTTTSRHVEDPRRWQLILDLKTSRSGTSIPYHFELKVVGFFEVAPDFPMEKAEELVRVTGSSILYSGAREFILGITSRGPWGSVSLPTMSFIKPVEKVSIAPSQKKSKKAS